MISEDEQIARPYDRIRLDFRNRIFIGETGRGILRLEQTGDQGR